MRIRANILSLLLAAACANAGDPTITARRYEEAVFAGDMGTIYRLLSTEDQQTIPRSSFPDSLPPGVGFLREGLQRTTVDTLIAVVAHRDSAIVAVTIRAPNYFFVLSEDRDDRQSFDSRVAAAPLVTETDTVRLRREGKEWRVSLELPALARLAPLSEGFLDREAPPQRRAEFAARYLEAIDTLSRPKAAVFADVARKVIREGDGASLAEPPPPPVPE